MPESDVRSWPPTRYSQPLTPEFKSLYGRYKNVFRIAWQKAYGYDLSGFQESLLEALTELRADGRLRYRQVLVSVGRQNGKTEIAAALGLLWLIHFTSPFVVGIASSAEQANLVYRRTMNVIRFNPALAKKFDALTETRGIRAKDGGVYEMKASKSASLQGLPVALGVADEVHLLKPALWTDLLNGTGGRPDTLIVGITTAGDESSELLKHLYSLAESGEGGETFGHFIWEAPEAHVPEDDAELADYLRAANPAIAEGRVDVDVVIADVRTMPPEDAVRYRLNRFTATGGSFIEAGRWHALRGVLPTLTRPVFAVTQTPDRSWATITAAQRIDGVTYTEVVASVPNPDLPTLERLTRDLGKHKPSRWVVDGYSLRALGESLKNRGQVVTFAREGEDAAASSSLYALIAQKKVVHPGDQLLTVQLPQTTRKNIGERFKIARSGAGAHIDSVYSTAYACYFAEIDQGKTFQMFT